MDQFLVSLLLLDEMAIVGISFLLIVAGGILAAVFLNVNTSFRRVSYIWFIALLGLALTISQFLWVLTPAAADAGMLSPLIIIAMGSFAMFGAGLYFSSAARSRHISGGTSNAVLGFIPLANLWLIFKAGGTHGTDVERKPRSALSRFVFDPLLVVAALCILMLSQGIDKALQNTTYYEASDSQVLSNLLADAQTLEESFAAEARLSRAQLPIRIDESTVISEIEARGETLIITYDVEIEISGFRTDFKTTLAQLQCAPEMFGSDIARGGIVEMIYRGPNDRVIETFKITQKDCAL